MAASPENPNQAIDFMLPITTIHVALMVVLAIAAVATIVWGSMLARRRKNAEKQVEENFEVAEAHGATHEPTVSADGTQVATMSADVPERPAQDTDRQEPVAPRIPEDRPVSGAAPATAAPEPAPAPAPSAAPLAAPAPAASALTQIKGLGPKLTATLAEQGITRVEQIAALTPSDAEALDAKLGAFRGRMTRDRWIEQARLLSAGDRAGYEAQFGKLGG